MGWGKLGESDTSVEGDAVTVSMTASKKFHHSLCHALSDFGQNTIANIRCGNSSVDTGANYAARNTAHGGGGTDLYTSKTGAYIAYDGNPNFVVVFGVNIATEEKLFITLTCEWDNNRSVAAGKWANTTNQFDQFEHNAAAWQSAGRKLGPNTNLSVMGSD